MTVLLDIATEPEDELLGLFDDHAPLRVVIADDHPLLRRSVARAIARHPELELVGEAPDGRRALELIDALAPDVAVLDHRMPELTGVEVCERLAARLEPPATALLVLSAFEDPEIVAGAVRGGAVGYLPKTASLDQVCDAILRVATGDLAFDDELARGANRHLRTLA